HRDHGGLRQSRRRFDLWPDQPPHPARAVGMAELPVEKADRRVPAEPRGAMARPGRLTEFWRYYRENRGAVIGLWFLGIVVVLAILADLVAPHSPIEQYRDALLRPPVWENGGTWDFVLGTDAIGRDMLSRIIHGARYSLFIGAVVVTLALIGGVTLGLIAGFMRGWVDTVIMRLMDIILAFPSLLLALVLVAILGPGLFNAMIAIAVVLQPHYVRLTRAAVLSERTKDYVVA